MKTLLLGFGNPILSDDAVGVRLAKDFKANNACRPGLDIVEECSVGGMNLLDVCRGYQRAIVLDAIQTDASRPGTWHYFTADALRETAHLTNIHDVNFATALELGRRLGLALPEPHEIHIVGVEIQDDQTFSEQMTPLLEQAYPGFRSTIFDKIREIMQGGLVRRRHREEAVTQSSTEPFCNGPN